MTMNKHVLYSCDRSIIVNIVKNDKDSSVYIRANKYFHVSRP